MTAEAEPQDDGAVLPPDSPTAQRPVYSAWRRICFWWRFRSLALARRVFLNAPSPCIVERPLFGYRCCLDVSRGEMQQVLYLEGERYIQERFLVSKLLKPGMHVVDVGANVGYYLLMFERGVGRDGQIVSIEPSPLNLTEIRLSIEANEFRNVQVHDVAVGTEEGKTGLLDGINSGVVGTGEGAFDVEMRSLDSLLTDRVDLLKIDVEGYEGQVLSGARSVLERDRPVLFLEVHPFALDQHGFTIHGLVDLINTYYRTLTCYEVPPATQVGTLTKISTRYFGANPVVQIADTDALWSACERNERGRCFWIVAQ